MKIPMTFNYWYAHCAQNFPNHPKHVGVHLRQISPVYHKARNCGLHMFLGTLMSFQRYLFWQRDSNIHRYYKQLLSVGCQVFGTICHWGFLEQEMELLLILNPNFKRLRLGMNENRTHLHSLLRRG